MDTHPPAEVTGTPREHAPRSAVPRPMRPAACLSLCSRRRAHFVFKSNHTPEEVITIATDYTIEPAGAKVEIVGDLRELVGQTKAAILTDYRGLSVAELTELRKKLREVDGEYRVVKNTLFKLAAGDTMPVGEMSEFLAGPTAIGFAKGDPVAVAKIMLEYAQAHKAMTVKAGVMDGRVLTPAQVDALSKTPPREVLLSQMLGSLQSPIAGFVGTLGGIVSNFVFTLQAIADKQSTGADAAPAA